MKVFLLHRDRDFDVKPELRDEMFDAMLSGNLFAITNVSRNRERARIVRLEGRATDKRRRAGAGPRAQHAVERDGGR